jgi:hypothetical protein
MPRFTEAEEKAFARMLGRPRSMPAEVIVSEDFRYRFPASCEVSRERSGDYELHIYFDNGQEVGCWSLYNDGTQEGEILSDEDAASVRSWCRVENKIRRLTKAQRRAFELIAINLDHGTSPKIAAAVLKHGLIESYEETKPSWPTPVTVRRYSVPLPVHRIWCYLASEEVEEEANA